MARIKYYNAESGAWEYADAGTGIDDSQSSSTSTYSSQKVEALIADVLPTITALDEGKFLRVSSEGAWIVEAIPNAEGVNF